MDMEMKRKIIGAVIGIMAFAALIVGATYAWFLSDINVTNANYVTRTGCFQIDYNINNVDNSQDITGSLIPSASPANGLSGRVGLKINNNCQLAGTGTLKLHVNASPQTSTKLTTSAESYCQSRKTLEKINGITTKSACEADNVKGRWMNYGDSYCESNATYERLTSYNDSSSCTSNSGTWKQGGSPLKYAVYNNANATGTPLSKGYITDTDIGDDVTLLSNISITSTQQYFYIFIWLDGYLTDSTYVDLPFNGAISASAVQSE